MCVYVCEWYICVYIDRVVCGRCLVTADDRIMKKSVMTVRCLTEDMVHGEVLNRCLFVCM